MFNKLEARVLSEYKRSRAAPSTFCTLIKHYFRLLNTTKTTDTVVISFVFSSWIINEFSKVTNPLFILVSIEVVVKSIWAVNKLK
jgi:hypothetical protein